MTDKEKQQCVICHKDIRSELPKIDIYGNHYCKDCYIEKCKYEIMNMRDTILINKELLKRELQYLEEQTRKYTRKETAREIFSELYMYVSSDYLCGLRNPYKSNNYMGLVERLAKQFGVDLGE